ncbi:MAG: hypothetical protein A2W90_18645 [Bacteroidetes bacterium GWF2_42_66]|nr:MAG: hypothetical protein A2W92_05450 [Bacteroidetes bacterium GWA2_42_15]OFX98804.1 MAG: hypothetical protein A2W89_11050 [Bacteroidetes bacterium GWE2_42_39]OFY42999.1 MAG: hypothetical protein A2W90_18645 [Bacteroidetes bacterium GWF2_42_66]HBL77167.1 hypothetical protein [Prolixibacteraceae bacterium]HCU59779.1 hypothetical protein [Prolixibacteraceae bacterium]
MKRQTTLFNNQSGPACQTRLWYRCLLKSVLIIILMGIIVTVQACSKDEEQNEEQIPPKVSEDPLPNPPENVEFIQSVSVGSNHEILVNGKPFFPIMSWAQSEKNYSMLKSLGMNTHAGAKGAVAAKQVGCYAVPNFSTDVPENGNILAWIFDDEPDMPSGTGANAKPKKTPEYVTNKSDSIRKLSPNKLLFMTFTGHFTVEQSTYPENVRKTLYPQYITNADVVGFDIYPIYGSGYAAHLDWVGKGVSQLCDLAGTKPVYAWIETSKGSKWMTYEKQPDVLPVHTRNEVWQAITNGATAIGYFTHAWQPSFTEFAPTQDMQTELKRLNIQISRLSPAILATPANRNISMLLGSGLNCNFKATIYKNDLYIFSVNMDLGEGAKTAKQFDPIYPRGGKAIFSIEGLKTGTEVLVIDEKRTIIAENGKFSDDFAPLAEHIYRIKL